MKDIKTLVPDIQELLKTRGWFDAEKANAFATGTARRLEGQFDERPRQATLRLSQMGARCPKALWYSIHHPELAEDLPPWATLKYSFGHLIEALAIELAKSAGHEVTGEQDELTLDGIVGHRDCVIDGCIVDVKSSASRSFQKFKTKDFSQDDTFGYLDQLDGYVVASLLDPLVRVKDKGYILAVDKQLGHMALYEHTIRQESIRQRIRAYKDIVGRDTPPPCECRTIAQGTSGNVQLDTKASYSAFKHCCFPLLRTFLYANGPVYLTKVIKRPTNDKGPITEISKDGHIVYH